jgi:hypothetical protein
MKTRFRLRCGIGCGRVCCRRCCPTTALARTPCADRSAWLMVSVLAQAIGRYVGLGMTFVAPVTPALSLAFVNAMGAKAFVAPANAHLWPGSTPNDNTIKAATLYDVVSNAGRVRCPSRVIGPAVAWSAQVPVLLAASCVDIQHDKCNGTVAVASHWPGLMPEPKPVRGCSYVLPVCARCHRHQQVLCSLLMPVTYEALQRSNSWACRL